MQVSAKLSNLRVSPKKIRLIINLVRGLDVQEAKRQLLLSGKVTAKPISVLLDSAIANAKNNLGLEEDNLYIETITVGDGVTIKRWRPRAFGRAAMIRKRTSHVDIVLGEKNPTQPKKDIKSKTPEVVRLDNDSSLKKGTANSIKKDGIVSSKTKGDDKGFAKKVFQRKAG